MKPDTPSVVLDTDVTISAIIFGGNPRTILDACRHGQLQLFTSRTILLELATKLHHKFDYPQSDIKTIIKAIGTFAEIVTTTQTVHKITQDPTDNMFLEYAQQAQADYLISGDRRHILPLKKYKGTKILSPAKFVKKLGL